MWVIDEGSHEAIGRMLGLPEGSSWWLHEWKARPRWIDARFFGPERSWAIVRVLEGSRELPSRVPRRSAGDLQIAVVKGSGPAGLDELLDALVVEVEAHGSKLRWRQRAPEPVVPEELAAKSFGPRDVEVERLAFKAGLKPALRANLDPEEGPYQAQLWLDFGAAVGVVEFSDPGGGAQTYLMVAGDRARCEALIRAELDQHRDDPEHSRAAVRRCGELLGYPSCCVDAFLASLDREIRSEPQDRVARRGNWHRFDEAWVPRPDPRLNTLLDVDRLGLLSFTPCRFDCPAAQAIAARVAPIVEAEYSGYLRTLAVAVAVDDHDHRCALEFDEDGRRIRSARVLGGERALPGAQAFADALVGSLVDEQGRVPSHPEPCRVLRFDLGPA